MNKFTKSILALGLALSILIGVSGTSVFAASRSDYRFGNISNKQVTCVSNINYSTASATTSFQASGKLDVASTYAYVNTNTLIARKTSKSRIASKNPTVSFCAPVNCKSVWIQSTHTVEAYNQVWKGTTYCVY